MTRKRRRSIATTVPRAADRMSIKVRTRRPGDSASPFAESRTLCSDCVPRDSGAGDRDRRRGRTASRRSMSPALRATSTSLCSTAKRTGRPGDWVLIHVGFALSKVDEDEAQATLACLQRDGRGIRAGARGPEGERDRVSDGCSDGHCITCSDEGVPMRVVEAGAARARVCVCDDGDARPTVMTDLVGDVAARRRRARPRRRCDREAGGQ